MHCPRDLVQLEQHGELPTDPSTWIGSNSITNNVQAQLGISVFLPFSWEYRLPK